MNQEELLQVQYLVKSDLGKNLEINVILTNPSQDDIENAFTHLPKDIENLTKKLPIENYNVCRIVLEY